jgi:hypothetical protein
MLLKARSHGTAPGNWLEADHWQLRCPQDLEHWTSRALVLEQGEDAL